MKKSRPLDNASTLLLATLLMLGATTCGSDVDRPSHRDTESEGREERSSAVRIAASGFREAPVLARLVAGGQLPPVEQRLPQDPLVVQPVERTGKYGGTWRMGLRGGNDNALLLRTLGYENLVRWDPGWTQVIPNLAESFRANDEATEFTFKLREGMRWSDGHPFTADDILFWFEDVLLNRELTAVMPNWLVTRSQPVVVEKVNDFMVRFRFASPNGLFLKRLATPEGAEPTRYPKHYLKQYHLRHNPGGIERLIRQEGARDWVDLFQRKGGAIPGSSFDARWQNRSLPTLFGWMLTTAYGEGPRVVAERNPFYWKVDPAGNQLPYIDRLVYEVGEDVETLVLKVLNGEIDMQSRHISSNENRALFTDNMQRGGYHFAEIVPSSNNTMVISLNLTHKDPAKRAIFQNRDFRIGLSYAIDRREIIDLLFVGEGQPFQVAPRPESRFYNERMATQYTEYDLARANAHLDRAGFARRDGDGLRLGPDGKRISFTVEVPSTVPANVDALELIRGYWKRVGIDMQIRAEDRSLMYTRKEANDHDAVVWGGAGGWDAALAPRYYFPYTTESNYAIAWQFWYNQDPRGEEPPPRVNEQMGLYDELKATADETLQDRLMTRILEIAADEFYTIGICLSPPGFAIVKDNLHNVPGRMISSWVYPDPAPVNPCQFFFE